MTKQLISIILFMYTISVTINTFGKVDAYITGSASYSWTDSDLDNIIPDENDDVFQKSHSYFAYSIHDNEDSKYMNKENNNVVEEVIVPLSNLGELSPNPDNGNETETAEEISKKEFMNDMHKLINTLVEESDIKEMPIKEEDQEHEDEQEFEVSVPLLDKALMFDPMVETELFSLIVPEPQKDVSENKSQKEIPSAESNPVLISAFTKESSTMPSKIDELVRNQKSITPSLKTNENDDTGEIILEMDLFPLENKAQFPEHRSTYHSSLPLEKPLLPFLFSSRLPHSWQSLVYPANTYMHHSAPSSKLYFNPQGELKDINPRKILNSLKATSIGEMEYQPLGEHLFSSPIGYHDSSRIYGHSPYHNGDVSCGSLDLGGLLHGGISINNLREGKYVHKNHHTILPSVNAVTQLEVMMNPAKRVLRKMMVIEPPAVLRIEPVIWHHTYKHPQTHVVF